MFFISLANNHATFFIIFFQRFKELHQVRNIRTLLTIAHGTLQTMVPERLIEIMLTG